MGEQNSLEHLSHFCNWTFTGESKGHPGSSVKQIKIVSEYLGFKLDASVTSLKATYDTFYI